MPASIHKKAPHLQSSHLHPLLNGGYREKHAASRSSFARRTQGARVTSLPRVCYNWPQCTATFRQWRQGDPPARARVAPALSGHMAKCSICGAETQLHHGGQPICPKCDDELTNKVKRDIDKRKSSPKPPKANR